MKEMTPLNFMKGLKDGLPIALGYLSVSFTFGILVVSYGLPIWTPIVTSITNFTGTGQFIGMEMLKNGAALYEIGFTMLIINIRYVLMSISMSQKMNEKVGVGKRLLVSFGVTDEVYAVSMSQDGELTFPYLMGLMLGSFTGWLLGTVLGALAGSIIPAIIISAMGITIYAMFIAIIVPPAKDEKPVFVTILIAVIISSLLSLIKVLRENNFYIIIIAGILATIVTTFLYPIREEVDTSSDIECEEDILKEALKEDNSITIETTKVNNTIDNAVEDNIISNSTKTDDTTYTNNKIDEDKTKNDNVDTNDIKIEHDNMQDEEVKS